MIVLVLSIVFGIRRPLILWGAWPSLVFLAACIALGVECGRHRLAFIWEHAFILCRASVLLSYVLLYNPLKACIRYDWARVLAELKEVVRRLHPEPEQAGKEKQADKEKKKS